MTEHRSSDRFRTGLLTRNRSWGRARPISPAFNSQGGERSRRFNSIISGQWFSKWFRNEASRMLWNNEANGAFRLVKTLMCWEGDTLSGLEVVAITPDPPLRTLPWEPLPFGCCWVVCSLSVETVTETRVLSWVVLASYWTWVGVTETSRFVGLESVGQMLRFPGDPICGWCLKWGPLVGLSP